MDTQQAIQVIKAVLANVSPEQIGADIGGQVTDYDLRVPVNYQPDGEQHPTFFEDKLQKDK